MVVLVAGEGRFDLDPPRGTCYLADDPLVAVLELLGAVGSVAAVHPSVLEGAVVWSLPMPTQCDAADATHAAPAASA